MLALPAPTQPRPGRTDAKLSEGSHAVAMLRGCQYSCVYPQPRWIQQPTRELALASTIVHPNPSKLPKPAAQALSPYPLVVNASSVVWLPKRGQAWYLLRNDAKIQNLPLRDKQCEIFWTSPANTLHYAGRFMLEDDEFPYCWGTLGPYEHGSERELDLVKQLPSRGKTASYKFVVLQYVSWDAQMMASLSQLGMARPLSDGQRRELREMRLLD